MEFHPISELDKKIKPEVLAKARKLCEQELLNIRLKELRDKCGIKQVDVANFSQTAVSKLERRKDIRISTLIDYLDSLGMGLEIAALPKGKSAKKEILLRI
ncbi:MAG: helix-turn-helix transcriptional regulator [Treponema sp.]|nr:helix-turn-helix transcriptional regulator [Treponema sp.]